MSKKSNMKHQFIRELKKETKFGESKHQAKQKAREIAKNNNEKYQQVKGIYSKSTYADYLESCEIFTRFVLAKHSEVKSIEDARKYIPEYIDSLREKELSEWTIHKYAYALRSAYHSSLVDLGITLGERRRAEITRCRGAEDNALRNQPRFNHTLMMVKATGCRRKELLRLRPEDFRYKSKEDSNGIKQLEVFKRGKNGIERWCSVNPALRTQVESYIKNHTPILIGEEHFLFSKKDIPSKMPVHDLRGAYACGMYQYYEKEGYSNHNIYHCRRELKGISYDKGVLEKVSFDLQHSRNNVVINYLYDL